MMERKTDWKCPECGGTNLVEDPERGEIICRDCSVVVAERRIDQGPEWRAYNSKEREERSRATFMRNSPTPMQLGTFFRRSYEEEEFRRLGKRHNQVMFNSRTKTLHFAGERIDKLCSSLGLPSYFRSEALRIYEKALRKGLLRGENTDISCAACIYYVCRGSEDPRLERSLFQISKAIDQPIRRIGRVYRKIRSELEEELNFKPKLRNPWDILPSILEGEELRVAKKIAEVVKENKINAGKSHLTVGAAIAYITNVLYKAKRGERGYLTQDKIASKVGITDVTVKNRYKELMEKLEFIVEI